ncbi:hypothetical protein BC829DRAFT_240228 [Chytridium lagenaria]|nr:hypothetical protein BC829DRAFT_240228 [Chytridium lagenaria]
MRGSHVDQQPFSSIAPATASDMSRSRSMAARDINGGNRVEALRSRAASKSSRVEQPPTTISPVTSSPQPLHLFSENVPQFKENFFPSPPFETSLPPVNISLEPTVHGDSPATTSSHLPSSFPSFPLRRHHHPIHSLNRSENPPNPYHRHHPHHHPVSHQQFLGKTIPKRSSPTIPWLSLSHLLLTDLTTPSPRITGRTPLENIHPPRHPLLRHHLPFPNSNMSPLQRPRNPSSSPPHLSPSLPSLVPHPPIPLPYSLHTHPTHHPLRCHRRLPGPPCNHHTTTRRLGCGRKEGGH